ncbi:MAG: glycoside hydrolase/phage tail family protein [Caulobacteraceae bacterium]|nr:glycoside hydrolase/phage tail family protein [Caulobacteraceae bacterium]
MAQVVLGGLGAAVGGGVGRVLGAALGGVIDRSVLGALAPERQRGPRLETLRIQSTAEGAPMACVFGRARITGQMIWAARFFEQRRKSGGGKGGPATVDHAYSLSFAVALCEGPIDGVGRIWADGQLLDQTGVTMRVYRGTEDQTPDSLIEAVEGSAPAYRGTAYVVFEDLALAPFGNRAPQLSFEVFRRPGDNGLEDRIEGVCLTPGAGEFVLATEPVFRREGLTVTAAENVHSGDGRTDLIVSLDQLEAQCPNLRRVSLVIGWFGNDLRAGHCRVKPGVERRDKPTEPQSWSVAGLERGQAHLISQVEGRPAYGGTPSDTSVRQAIEALKARGWAVTLYPFVFMDVPADNDLPDPYGGGRQAAYPWRGRIKGEDGPGAGAAIDAMFGTPDDWGLQRLSLHYAALAAETGCAGLLIGSEMRGLTWTRDASGGYPAVARFRALAGACRAVVGPGVALSYAADWSEYSGHRPEDGSGDVIFHLDPLWADPAIDYVGIDWYPPLGDWRGEGGGIDATTFAGEDDPAYLAAQVAGGEGFDWFYTGYTDRAAQVRTPIVDTAHGEDWVFRVKDLKGWWSNGHHDRPGGVRNAAPTAWTPGMKPIRLTEFGCAAVDRGGNAPNLFQDPKSSESVLPPYSTGGRDDRMQRRAIEAVLGHFDDPGNNPVSAVYGAPMMAGADLWCWDARPFPAFPALETVWSDAGAWRTGHWLNGRLSGDTSGLLAAMLKRGGLEDDDFAVGEPVGSVEGYVIDRPMRTRDSLEPLLQALDMTVAERGGRVELIGREEPGFTLAAESLSLREVTGPTRMRALEPRPESARVRFIDEGADYQTGAATVRAEVEAGGGGVDADLPAVCSAGLAGALAQRLLKGGGADRLMVGVGPLDAIRIESGDTLAVEGEAGGWRVERLALDETPTVVLVPRDAVQVLGDDPVRWRPVSGIALAGRPFATVLDLPPLPGAEADDRVIAAVSANPWQPMAIHVGEGTDTLTLRGRVTASTTVGQLTDLLGPGVPHRWDETGSVRVRLEGPAPRSATAKAVLGGANLAAVQTGVGWEVLQFRQANLVGEGVWRLSGLLRGQQGTEVEMAAGAGVGATLVLLDPEAGRFPMAVAERGLPRMARVGPEGQPPGGARFTEVSFEASGLHGRPWSPVRLKVRTTGAGQVIEWLPRVRLGGDVWDFEPTPVDPVRFRIRVSSDGTALRMFETETTTVLYPVGWMTEDFPDGVDPVAVVHVAQFGAGFGWGVEAQTRLFG